MTTLLAPTTHRTYAFSAGFGLRPAMFRKDNGALRLEGVAVFRTGTFRDSMGEQNTWESMHLSQMVANFNHLVGTKVFDDVPVRDGHPHFLLGAIPGAGQVKGYHTQLATARIKAPHDDQEYDYLMADYEILDPQFAAKVESGLMRNRSAEIGGYRTNNESEHWPVYLGFAYVDIPAVEGLKFSSTNGSVAASRAKFFVIDKEMSVTQPAQAPSALPFAMGGQTFSIDGRQVTDATEVQNHINALEQFRTEVTESNRREFVNGLVASNRLPITEVDKTVAFAASLNVDQYTAWVATFGQATVPAALGTVNAGTQGTTGAGVTNHTNAGQASAQPTELQKAAAVVANFKAAGMLAKQIEATASYQKLKAAGQAPAL